MVEPIASVVKVAQSTASRAADAMTFAVVSQVLEAGPAYYAMAER